MMAGWQTSTRRLLTIKFMFRWWCYAANPKSTMWVLEHTISNWGYSAVAASAVISKWFQFLLNAIDKLGIFFLTWEGPAISSMTKRGWLEFVNGRNLFVNSGVAGNNANSASYGLHQPTTQTHYAKTPIWSNRGLTWPNFCTYRSCEFNSACPLELTENSGLTCKQLE